jgi:hypothetical protein
LAVARLIRRDAVRAGPWAALQRVESDHPPARADDRAMHRRVIERYVSNKRAIEALAAAYDVSVAFVWQPVPVYKYDLHHHVFKGDFGGHAAAGHGYPRMARFVRQHPLGEDFLWCADIQEGLAELLYVDSVHYSPRLSARLAGCISALLAERGLLVGAEGRDP